MAPQTGPVYRTVPTRGGVLQTQHPWVRLQLIPSPRRTGNYRYLARWYLPLIVRLDVALGSVGCGLFAFLALLEYNVWHIFFFRWVFHRLGYRVERCFQG